MRQPLFLSEEFYADYDDLYDWRSTVSEDIQGAIEELDTDIIDLKPVNNYTKGRNGKPTVVVNPNVDLKESIEQLGGEMLLLDDIENISYSVADYFIDQGLDDYDIALMKEEMGADDFIDMVMEIYDEFVINEARRDRNWRIEPKTSTGKPVSKIYGGARTSAIKRLQRLGDKRRAGEQPPITPTRADELRARRLERQRQLASGEVQPRRPGISDPWSTPSRAKPKSAQQSMSAQQSRPTLMLPPAGGTSGRGSRIVRPEQPTSGWTYSAGRMPAAASRSSYENGSTSTNRRTRKAPSTVQQSSAISSLPPGQQRIIAAAQKAAPAIKKAAAGEILSALLTTGEVLRRVGKAGWEGHRRAMEERGKGRKLGGQLAAGAGTSLRQFGSSFLKNSGTVKEFVEYLIDDGYDISDISLLDLYEELEYLEEKAASEQQQRIFGLALSVKRGDIPRSKVSRQVLEIVDNMSEREIRKFAKTKHGGLPVRVSYS